MKSIAAIAMIADIMICSSVTLAQTDKYHVTAEEKAACEGDASQLCSSAGNDEDALLSCMRTNKARLSPGCQTVFESGLKKRGLR